MLGYYRDGKHEQLNGWYTGTVGEKPAVYNSYRYLVFFDDGSVQYLGIDKVRLIYWQMVNVRESHTELGEESSSLKRFLAQYLAQYPDRMMVRVRHAGQKVKAEKNGRWYVGEQGEKLPVVKEIDGTLIKVHFPDGSSEWMFRGSPRMWEISQGMQSLSASQRMTHRHRLVRNPTLRQRGGGLMMVNEGTVGAQLQTARKKTAQLSRDDEEGDSEDSDENDYAPASRQYIATRRSWNFSIENDPLPLDRKRPRSFNDHPRTECGPECISGVDEFGVMQEGRGKSPFVVPLLCGWEREVRNMFDPVAARKRQKPKKFVYYIAPCGRSLRSMQDLLTYIKVTGSILPGDFFTYDKNVRPLVRYKVLNPKYEVTDYSQGTENVPIPAVNTFENEEPPNLEYSADRYPWEGVTIPMVCSGCSCDDDCSDHNKCECQHLSVEGAASISSQLPVTKLIYYQRERRLQNNVFSGIFECNDNCHCRKGRCVNRVAQRKLVVPLQLFKTMSSSSRGDKGWGIRTLVDIPRGQFICIYAGAIIPDEEAEKLGIVTQGGDEYFADLDLIGTVENEKEGYESDGEEGMDQDEPSETEQPEGSTDDKAEESEASPTMRKSGGMISENSMIPATDAPDLPESNNRFALSKYYGEENLFVIDAKRCGNLGRYLNHSCDPNLFVQNVLVDTHDLRFPWVSFFALRMIKAGEELCWDYNYSWGTDEEHKIICKCGAKMCRGRLR